MTPEATSTGPDGGSPPRKGRPKLLDDEVRRRQILEVASRLLLEHGYRGVTMSKLAAAARISLNTVYRLFPGKSDLFAAITRDHRRSMVALPGEYDSLPLADALAEIFHLGLDANAELRRARLAQILMTEAERTPELGAVIHAEGPELTHRLLMDWLVRQRDLGRIDCDCPASTAKMLMDIAFGAPGSHRGAPSLWPGESDRAAHLKTCFAIVARGLERRER